MRAIINKVFSVLTNRERRGFASLVLMMVTGGLLESLSVTLVIPLITGIMDADRLTQGVMGGVLRSVFGQRDGQTYLALLLGSMIAVFICKNAFLVWRTYMQNRAVARIRSRVQNLALRYYLTRPYAFFLEADSGEVLRTVSSDSEQFGMLVTNVLGFFTSLVIVTIMSAVVFAIHPQITMLIAVVLLVEYAIILKLIRPQLHDQGERSRAAARRGNNSIIEIVRGIKSVKMSSAEPLFAKSYARDVDVLTRARMIEQTLYALPQRFIEGMTVSTLLVYLLIMLAGGSDMGNLVPVLSAFVLASSRILPCVSGISSSVSNSHYCEPALDHILEIDAALKREEESQDVVPGDSSEVPETFSRAIVLDGISFSYPRSEEAVLRHASMTIPCNASVGIVGSSGAGKTTLVDVLLGLLMPQEGVISMDGVPVDTSSAAWRSKFAYIPQNVFMLSGTVRDNVVFGQDEQNIDVARIWDALEAAQLAEHIRSLEDGLDTDVGEAGIRLSGGQIQRLGIARALYADAPILVFDEATSALDNDTEAALMEAIASIKGTKTLIIIAHRLTTIENCDIVYRVEDGAVAQVKSPADRTDMHTTQD